MRELIECVDGKKVVNHEVKVSRLRPKRINIGQWLTRIHIYLHLDLLRIFPQDNVAQLTDIVVPLGRHRCRLFLSISEISSHQAACVRFDSTRKQTRPLHTLLSPTHRTSFVWLIQYALKYARTLLALKIHSNTSCKSTIDYSRRW